MILPYFVQRENESALSKRLAEVSEELRKAETKNQSLSQMVESGTAEAENVKGQLAELHRIDGDRTNTLQIIQAQLKVRWVIISSPIQCSYCPNGLLHKI